MKSIAAVTFALLLGCAIGVVFRGLVFPAHAAPPAEPVFEYRAALALDLVKRAQQDAKPQSLDKNTALAEAMSYLGRSGWHYVGCVPSITLGGIGATTCDTLLFERERGAAEGASPATGGAGGPPR